MKLNIQMTIKKEGAMVFEYLFKVTKPYRGITVSVNTNVHNEVTEHQSRMRENLEKKMKEKIPFSYDVATKIMGLMEEPSRKDFPFFKETIMPLDLDVDKATALLEENGFKRI